MYFMTLLFDKKTRSMWHKLLSSLVLTRFYMIVLHELRPIGWNSNRQTNMWGVWFVFLDTQKKGPTSPFQNNSAKTFQSKSAKDVWSLTVKPTAPDDMLVKLYNIIFWHLDTFTSTSGFHWRASDVNGTKEVREIVDGASLRFWRSYCF